MLNEISQTQKEVLLDLTYIWNLKKLNSYLGIESRSSEIAGTGLERCWLKEKILGGISPRDLLTQHSDQELVF